MAPIIFKEARRSDEQSLDFVLSDETKDRMGDVIIASGWDLKRFRKNPVALYGHDSAALPIGKWANVKIDGKRLVGTLQFPEIGTPARTPEVEAIASLIEQRILNAVSVGFHPLEAEPLDKDDPWGGFRFIKSELVECSVVPVPANPNALAIRSLRGIDPVVRSALAKPGKAPSDYDRGQLKGIIIATPGAPKDQGNIAMSIKDKIAEKRGRIVAIYDELKPLNEFLAGDGLNAEQGAQFDALSKELEEIETELRRLETARRAAGIAADTGPPIARVAPIPGVPALRANSIIVSRAPPLPAGEHKRDILSRLLVINLRAFTDRTTLEAAAQACYPERDDLLQVSRSLMYTAKAATQPAMTTVAGWAAELVRDGFADMLETLVESSVYAQLTTLPGAYRFSFDGFGRMTVPRRNRVQGATGDLAGAFVGEGKPIPVRIGSVGSKDLTPKKMAVISSWTREMAERSTPQIEALIRQAINEDTATAIDIALLDANPETNIRPAGLGNAAVALAGAAGGDEAALRADLLNAIGHFTGLNASNGLAWIMNDKSRLAISFMVNAMGLPSVFSTQINNGALGGIPVLASTNVGPDDLWLVRYRDFASAMNDTPIFMASDQATVHEEAAYSPDITAGAAVLPIATGAAGAAVVATPIRSFFQTDTIGLRMILPMDWAMIRDSMVVKISGVTWNQAA